MLDPTTFAHPTPLPLPPTGWFDYHYSVLMDGRLALVRTPRDVHSEWTTWRNSTKRASLDGSPPPVQPDLWGDIMRLSIFDGTNETDVTIVPASAYPLVERCADGRWLVASHRGAARLYTGAGKETGAIWVGTDIKNLLCSPDGTIWIGYSDQGGFSPGDWGGIVQLDAGGQLVWSFNEHINTKEVVREEYCWDCYALALNGTSVWTCYYSLFDIVRIENGVVSFWPNSAGGPRAIAVSGDIALLAGGYAEHLTRIAVVDLSHGARSLGGFPFPDIARTGAGMVRGRDGVLHVVNRGTWFRLSPEEVAKDEGVRATLQEILQPSLNHDGGWIESAVSDW